MITISLRVNVEVEESEDGNVIVKIPFVALEDAKGLERGKVTRAQERAEVKVDMPNRQIIVKVFPIWIVP